MDTDAKRMEQASTVATCFFALNIVSNAASAVFDLEGSAWATYRWIVAALLAASLIGWGLTKLRVRRNRKRVDGETAD